MKHIDFLALMPSPKFKWACYRNKDGHRDARRIAGKAKTFLKRMQKLWDDQPPWGCRGAMIDLAERFAWETLRDAPKWFGDGGGMDTEPRYHVCEFAETVLHYAGIEDWRVRG